LRGNTACGVRIGGTPHPWPAPLLECGTFLFAMYAMSPAVTAPANAEKRYTVHRGDLPLSCPTPEMALWNSHPRVYLPIEDAPTCEAKCPYCGALFVLSD